MHQFLPAIVTFLLSTVVLSAFSFAQEQTFSFVARGKRQLKYTDKVVGATEPGDPLKVISVNRKWLLVETADGSKGWIDGDDVVKIADAGAIYDALIKAHPKVPGHYERRAMVWSARGETDKLLADYDEAIRLGSKNATIYSTRGVYAASQGKYENAVKYFDQAISLGLKEHYVYVNRGVARYAMRAYEKAVEDFSVAMNGGEKGYSLYLNRAMARAASGQEIEALEDLAEAVKLEPENPAAYHECGKVWKQLDNPEKAVAAFGEAIRVSPNYWPAYLSRGFIWFMKNEPNKAIADFDAVVQLNPKSALAYNNRGYNKQLIGQYDDAIEDYEQAIQLAPEYALAIQNKAWLLATCPDDRIRDGKKAWAMAKRSCELGEWKHWSDMKALAAAYAEAGDFKQAIHWQTRAIDLAPDAEKEEEQKLLDLYRSGRPHRVAVNPRTQKRPDAAKNDASG